LAPVLFRVPALFGVFRRDEQRSLSCCSPLHLLCCLAAHARARAGLLANSGCFVSKCVLWCFVVFAGVLWCFAGVLQCFASVLQYQYFHKTHKTPEKHRKTLKNKKNSQYARVLRAFSESK